MPDQPRTLAEAEVIARHAGKLNWWAMKIMREYDRREIERVAEQLQRVAEAQAAESRIELLTAALTELVQLYDGTHAMFTTIPRSIACGPITKVFEDAHDRARAALAPIEEKKD